MLRKLLIWHLIAARHYHIGEEELADDVFAMTTAVDYTSEEVVKLVQELYSCIVG